MTKQQVRDEARKRRVEAELSNTLDSSWERARFMTTGRFRTNKWYDKWLVERVEPIFKKCRVANNCIYAQIIRESCAENYAPKNSVKRRTPFIRMLQDSQKGSKS